MSSGLVEPARLIASARICTATTWRDVLSFRSLFALARNIAFTGAMAGRLLPASSANEDRLSTPSASGPAAVRNDCSWNPAACAMIAGGLKPTSAMDRTSRMASDV